MSRASESAYVSTARAAAALGVGVSTVKRWVDSGVLPAQKTAGGHRKVLVADVLALARRGDLPHVDLSQLAGSPHDLDRRLADRLHRALFKGDADAVRLLLLGARAGGATIADIADTAIGPAMAAIGHDWEAKRIEVLEEHRATQICAGVLYEMKASLTDRIEKDWPFAVGGAAQGDDANLGALLAQLSLLECGWNSVDLGANTPFDSLIRALAMRPRLMWLSSAHLQDAKSFAAEYDRFARRVESAGVPLAVGGRGFSLLGDSLRCSMRCSTMNQLVEFAGTLHAPNPRPTRGRPRGS